MAGAEQGGRTTSSGETGQGAPSPALEDLARALELQIARLLVVRISVRLTDNRKVMLSWATRAGVLCLRLHRMFAHAPRPVVEAVCGAIARRGRDPEADRVIGAFIEANRSSIRTTPRRRQAPMQGRWHDLEPLLAELNEQLLDGAFQGQVQWGRATRRRRRRSIRLGSYSPSERLIRIHPALDQAFVPRYVVAWILFHEMLHQLIPCPRRAGRRRWHTPEFRAREATFPDHARAQAWEAENLRRLLRYRGPGLLPENQARNLG